jgi:tetratricopeptide (TPR) repeat protein
LTLARSPAVLLALLSAGLLAATGPARGQDREPADIRFARALAARGWSDLAEEVLDDLAQAASTPKAVKDQVGLVRADLLVDAAAREEDAAKRGALVAKASDLLDAYAKAHAGTPAAFDAMLRVGGVSLEAGDAAAALARRSRGDVAAAAWREADERYERATKTFEDVVKGFVLPPPNEEGEVDPEAVYRLARANLLWARSYYKHAMGCADGAARDRLLHEAVTALQRVSFDFCDQVPGYEAQLDLGLAEKELHAQEEAVAAFRGAAGLLGMAYPEGVPRGEAMDPVVGDIVGRALYFLAQLQVEAGQYQAALGAVKEFRDHFPDLVARDDRLALAVALEEAKARSGAGDTAAAAQLIKAVQAADPDGPMGAMARATLSVLSGTGVSPEDAIVAAEALLDGGDVARGLARLRALVVQLEAAGAKGQAALPLAWYTMARAYYEQERFDEAFACFDLVARRYATSPYTARALFYAANCAGRLQAMGTSSFDEARYTEALTTLTKRFPGDTTAQAAGFLLGNQAVGAHDFVGAAARYATVTPAAGEYYDAALYQVGSVWTQEGRAQAAHDEAAARAAYGKALAAFKACIDWAAGNGGGTVDPASERGVTLKRLAVESWLRTAELRLDRLALDPAAALAAAKAAEAAVGPGHRERTAQARALAVRAHLAASQLPEAEAALKALLEVGAGTSRAAVAARDVGVALDQRAQALLRDDPTGARALLARAADCYALWLDGGSGGGLGYLQAARAGDRLFSIALVLNELPPTTVAFTDVADPAKLPAADRFGQAARAYTLALAGRPEETPPAELTPWRVAVKLGECLGFAGRYADAARTLRKVVDAEHLVGADQRIDVRVARDEQLLLFAYADGAEAARQAQDADLRAWALEALPRLLAVAPQDGGLWWRCKAALLEALLQKGDRDQVVVGLRSLRRQYPEFDAGRFGVQPKLEALARALNVGR